MSQEFRSRKNVRLKYFDYAQHGAYFVTICTQGRQCLFGDVVAGEMILNDAGKMVENIWNEMTKFYPNIETDPFVIMPNHIHGVIFLVGAAPRGRPCTPPNTQINDRTDKSGDGQPQGVVPTKNQFSVSDVVHRFKSFTTHKYIDGVKNRAWPMFEKCLWQRSFHERIIRNENEYQRICDYVLLNPENWLSDVNNLERFAANLFSH